MPGFASAFIRQRVASGLRFLDVTIDDDSNTAATPDCEITGDGRVRMFVIAAREELEIAHAVRNALADER